jgi:phage replication-related protein YjqB (UPF0714/DUF867 family)
VDRYRSFAELAAAEPQAFEIVSEPRGSDYLVAAVHAGQIETGTGEVASAIAGTDISHYRFEGRKAQRNATLHLTSTRFDEPVALTMAAAAATVVSVHGCQGVQRFSYIGGLDEARLEDIISALHGAGFRAGPNPDPRLAGRDRRNICNRGRSGMGVQIEIMRAERSRLLADRDLLTRYADAVRAGLSA